MYIWIFNHYACLRHGPGLTSHAVMAQTLAALGHEVTIFPAAFAQSHAPAVEIDGRRPFVDRFDDTVRFRFVRTLPYRTTPGRLLNMLSYRKNVGRCTAGLHRPDVIIGSLAHPHAVEAARRLARRFDCRFVYEIRDIWPQSLVELGGISRLHPIYWHFRALERHAFRHADGVISVLPGIAQYAAQHGVAASRTAYIPNGIDPELYPEPPDPPPIKEGVHGKTQKNTETEGVHGKTQKNTETEGVHGRTRKNTEEGKGETFVISCFTRFGSGNAMDTIIDAAANLQRQPNGGGIAVRLVGDGPAQAGLQRRVAELGLQNVEFLDLVSKPELVALAHQSHAFVHSHRAMPVVERYGMSVNKVFAFMASGRPVIFACRCCHDPIRDAKAGISIEPENPAAMARAMIDLRGLPAVERAAMGRRARRYVLKHHDLSKMAKRLEAFLESIL